MQSKFFKIIWLILLLDTSVKEHDKDQNRNGQPNAEETFQDQIRMTGPVESQFYKIIWLFYCWTHQPKSIKRSK